MLRNCINCGKVHTYPAKLCKECMEEKRNQCRKVKDFLWDNPNSTIDEVHEATGIKRERILQFVREDRFIVTGGIIQDPKQEA